MARARAQPSAELQAETPRVEPSAHRDKVGAVDMCAAGTGPGPAHVAELGPAIAHPTKFLPKTMLAQTLPAPAPSRPALLPGQVELGQNVQAILEGLNPQCLVLEPFQSLR